MINTNNKQFIEIPDALAAFQERYSLLHNKNLALPDVARIFLENGMGEKKYAFIYSHVLKSHVKLAKISINAAEKTLVTIKNGEIPNAPYPCWATYWLNEQVKSIEEKLSKKTSDNTTITDEEDCKYLEILVALAIYQSTIDPQCVCRDRVSINAVAEKWVSMFTTMTQDGTVKDFNSHGLSTRNIREKLKIAFRKSKNSSFKHSKLPKS